MSTFLFDDIVFGPIHSRRLGISLGVNLLPVKRKVCNFNCIYCECGLNNEQDNNDPMPSRKQVYEALERTLKRMVQNEESLDVITFAGNGEPTIHREFATIIDDTITLRDIYFPKTQVSVLSNATMLHIPAVVSALNKVDQNILKLDAGTELTIKKVNQPVGEFEMGKLIQQLAAFEGRIIIQTLFVRGEVNGVNIDNTSEVDLQAWETAIANIKPKKVMIYTIARDTPYGGLQKVPGSELKSIASRLKKYDLNVTVYS